MVSHGLLLYSVTLLASAPEFQYVALRNIKIILQKRPELLSNEIRMFFCRYNDPPYVKGEKLDLMIRLCNDRNIDQVLSELKEYVFCIYLFSFMIVCIYLSFISFRYANEVD